jgi:hypothetical protein
MGLWLLWDGYEVWAKGARLVTNSIYHVLSRLQGKGTIDAREMREAHQHCTSGSKSSSQSTILQVSRPYRYTTTLYKKKTSSKLIIPCTRA